MCPPRYTCRARMLWGEINVTEKITSSLVRRAMLEDLAASGIDESSAKKMKVKPLTPAMCEELTDIRVPAYEIPYFDSIGRTMKMASRVKFLATVPGNPDMRYWQRADTIPRAYLPPVLKYRSVRRWDVVMKSSHMPIYITEGEKKAASACINGLPCIGLGGVWSFKSKKAGIALLKELEKTEWKDRLVYIVFDSDVVEKPEVMRAMQALASTLRERGAREIRSISLSDGSGEKIGLDDFIVEHGVDKLESMVSEEPDALLNELNELNTRYAIVQSARDKIYDTEKRCFMSGSAFVKVAESNRVIHVVDEGGRSQRQSAAQAWLEWPNRREFADLVFEPGKPKITENNEYNFWDGYPYVPKRGSVRPFLDLVDSVLERCDRDVKKWFLQWMACPLAKPGTKLASAVVVWGEQGTGKTFLGKIVKDLYGDYGRLLSQLNLESGFNEWMINAQFVLGDEVVFHGDRRESNALKSIITRDIVTVNQKYQPTYTVRDYANYYFTSNYGDAIQMDPSDRRFLVVEVGDKQPRKFYDAIDRWLKKTDSYSHIMHYLVNLDLSGFDTLGEPPFTEQKEAMIHETMSGLDQVLEEALKAPDAFFQIAGNVIPRDLYTAEEILALLPSEFRNTSRNAVGRALRRAGCPKRGCAVRVPSGTAFKRLYAVRNVEKWRRATPPEMARHYEQSAELGSGNVVSLDARRRRKFARGK